MEKFVIVAARSKAGFFFIRKCWESNTEPTSAPFNATPCAPNRPPDPCSSGLASERFQEVLTSATEAAASTPTLNRQSFCFFVSAKTSEVIKRNVRESRAVRHK